MANKVYASRAVAGNADVASARVLGPNKQRSVIIFYPHATLIYSIGFGQEAELNKGVTIQPLGHPERLTYEQLGEQIHAAVHAISTAPCAFGILETLGDCPCTE